MTLIIRVHYEHQSDPKVLNTYADFVLAPNMSKVTKVELREIVPEHTKVQKTFEAERQT